MKEIFNKLKNGLVVSCQAEDESPFNSPEGVMQFAKAVIMGGAIAIRSEGYEKIRLIKKNIDLPVIGLIKSEFEDGFVRITGCENDVEKLLSLGCDIIAIDGTFRIRENLSGPNFINKIKSKYDCLIMADISNVEEAIACVDAGADCISTTLSGYTPETEFIKAIGADYKLVAELVNKLSCPIFAEGRVNSPVEAAKMIELGVWSVVVGSAITRPHLITSWFSDAIKNSIGKNK
ncbi:MAG: N-acetylmannosamine-6-phosphate 2-epimerase [Ignavibacteriales bacterium CG18_big_fil_WC_8_21_14_2_50_31_20]|nr:MAG: N-acetylmannosamine-6-phosphate 2-epimerase [Ignavibacteriales bacterium CG18_big_fil_WC_8_21_14_2_50_31_20]